MSRFRTLSTLLTVVFSLVVVAPGAVAQDAPPLVAPGDAVLQLYLAEPDLGGLMSTDTPTAETSFKKQLIVQAINPALGTTVVLGKFTPASDLVFQSDAVVSLWLASNQATMHDQIQARIVEGSTTKATGNTPLRPDVLQTTITNIRISLPTRGIELSGGEESRLEILLFGAGATGTPTDLALYWGSAAHPTGVSAAVEGGDFTTTSTALPLFLADGALTYDAPTGTQDLRKVVGTSCTGACLASSGAVAWGSGTATSDFVMTGETILVLAVGIQGTGAAADGPGSGMGVARQFTGTLLIGESSFAHTMGISAYSWTAATTVNTFRVSFATRGHEVKAGDPITLSYAFWSNTDTPATKLEIVYGSVGRPSGLMIPISGGGVSGVPLVGLTSGAATLDAQPGGTATSSITVSNEGGSPADVVLNATGELEASFSNTTVAVGPNNFTEVNVTFAMPAGVVEGDSFEMVVHAAVGGVEVSNVSFIVNVVGSDSPASTDTTPSTPPPSTSSANETAALKTQAPAEAVPGPLFAASLVTIVFVVVLRRRQG